MSNTTDTPKGEEFELNRLSVQQERLDSATVKDLLKSLVDKGVITEYQYKNCFNVTTSEQLRTKRISGQKADFTMPNLENATPEGLIDMLGKTREEVKDLQKLEGIYKEALKARL